MAFPQIRPHLCLIISLNNNTQSTHPIYTQRPQLYLHTRQSHWFWIPIIIKHRSSRSKQSKGAMSLRPSARTEVRRNRYKVAVDADEGRRRREDNMVEIRKSKREESLLKKRREGLQANQQFPITQSASGLEKKVILLHLSLSLSICLSLSPPLLLSLPPSLCVCVCVWILI